MNCEQDETLRIRMTMSQWVVVFAVLVCLVALRFVHLTADTPSWISPVSAGEYVDEGYKTLSARNLSIFGATHWHPLDDYDGWMKRSPITNWTYYAAFQMFGANLETARCVSIFAFTIFLLMYTWNLRHRLSFPVLLLGLLLLGLDGGLFFFSRLALLELPMILFLYSWLFILARLDGKVWWPLAGTILFAPVLGFGIKLSAMAYLAPIVIALLARGIVLRGIPRSLIARIAMVLAVVGVIVVMYMTSSVWTRRLNLSPVMYVTNTLASPAVSLTPFLMLTGWLCALHMVICRPSEIIASSYRTAVLALVLLGPLVMGLFPYNPPRYHVPLLPAAALVICEWLMLEGRTFAAPGRQRAAAVVGVIGITIWSVFVARAINHVVLMNLPLEMGDAPGIGERLLIFLALPASLMVAGGIWVMRDRLLRGRVVAAVVIASGCLFALHTSFRVGRFMLAPSYQGQAVRAAIAQVLPPGSSVIGDWAPFFSLGTNLRPLYMDRRINAIKRLPDLQPGYFLHCDTLESRVSREGFANIPGVHLGEPLIAAQYNDKDVVLYPIQYITQAEMREDEEPGMDAVPVSALSPASGAFQTQAVSKK